MNISLKQNIHNISFQKTLKAKASIKKDGTKFPVQIYHLDKNKDMDTFENALYTRNWDGNFYSENFITFCPEALDDTGYSLYTLENGKEVLGCVEIERKEDNIEVFLLEVAPAHSLYNPNRETKYIGETLLSFLATLAQSENKDLIITDIADREKTKTFYQQCGFRNCGKDSAILSYSRLGNLISNNEKHTGTKMQLIG